MMKRLTTAAVFLIVFAGVGLAQENPFKRFKQFKEMAPGIDFYASEKSEVEPFIAAVTTTREKLAGFLGDDIAPGAIFICSTLEQKDAVYDQRAFKAGYKWFLIQLTSEAQREERQARMAQASAAAAAAGMQGDATTTGGRGGGRQQGDQGAQGGRGGRQGGAQQQSPEFRAAQEARAATALAQQMGYAILMSSLNNEKPFRISRLDDMSRTPLNDWLDIALVAYATGTAGSSIRTMQDRIDDGFPLDDVMSMSRPFVAGQDPLSGGGGMAGMGGGGRGGGGGGRGGGGGAGGARVLPKDVMDRMVFDAQANTLFGFLLEKLGPEKVREIVQQNKAKTESLQVVMSLLDPNVDKIEKDWVQWVQAQKPAPAGRQGGPQTPAPGKNGLFR